MTWPAAQDKTNVDAATDDPKQARSDIAANVDKFNQLRSHVTVYIQGLLNDADAPAARTTLGIGDSGELFDTRAAVAAATIDAGTDVIRTAGYTTVGDGGGALYQRVGSEPGHALKVQSADSAWWELVADAGGVNVHQAGAVGDNTADDTQPIRDCIAFLGFDNGIVRFLNKTYKITDDIAVDFTIMFEGAGHGTAPLHDSTVISVASGKTGFKVFRTGSRNGDKSLFRNLTIDAVGKNTTTTTGTMTAASKTLTLASASDFADGDLIMLRGAGESQTLMNSNYLTGATTASSPTLTLSQSAGIYDGMVLEVAGASFPAGTFVSSRSGLTVTMSANAASTVSAGAITYFNDLCVEIISGGGTTTLVVNEAADRSVTAAVVRHYDCGIYSQSRIGVENVTIRDFQGAGLFLHAGSDVDSVAAVTTNANSWQVRGGIYTGCGNGLRLKGNDVNAGSAIGADVGANTEYGLVDASFLGNYFFGLHVSGAYGYMTVFLNANTTFDACYTEGGTINSFAQRTLVVGGLMGGASGNFAGGSVVITSSNRINQSETAFQPSWADIRLFLGDPDPASGGLFLIDASAVGGSAGTKFMRSTVAANGQDGLWGWRVDGSADKGAMYFSDNDADNGAGNAFFLNGFYVGREQTTLTQGNFRRRVGGTAAPSSGTWKRGDVIDNHAPSAGGTAGWICITDGTPGTWKTYGTIEA